MVESGVKHHTPKPKPKIIKEKKNDKKHTYTYTCREMKAYLI